MADFYDRITSEQAALISAANLFFVATADPALAPNGGGAGPLNLSPKGGVPLHVLDERRAAYLDYTGSGNETARHSAAGGPITVMVCAFERENAAVVRLYGRASVMPLAEAAQTAPALLDSPAESIALPERQAIVIHVERTSTSCGYGVPVMSFEADRTTANRGRAYKQRKKPGNGGRRPSTGSGRTGRGGERTLPVRGG